MLTIEEVEELVWVATWMSYFAGVLTGLLVAGLLGRFMRRKKP